MTRELTALRPDERAGYRLRELYRRHGYTLYRMSKFEEYDLYVRNKSFLVSEHILTFTDTDGRLMALKPDVTLSIVKNTPDEPGAAQKVCYNETVYRTSPAAAGYREIRQAGLDRRDASLCSRIVYGVLQNQLLLDRYHEFRTFVERKVANGFHITKDAGLFLAR